MSDEQPPKQDKQRRPRGPWRALPDGWQTARRPDGVWLQRRRADGMWEDVSGPYTQRSHAIDAYLRRFLQVTK